MGADFPKFPLNPLSHSSPVHSSSIHLSHHCMEVTSVYCESHRQCCSKQSSHASTDIVTNCGSHLLVYLSSSYFCWESCLKSLDEDMEQILITYYTLSFRHIIFSCGIYITVVWRKFYVSKYFVLFKTLFYFQFCFCLNQITHDWFHPIFLAYCTNNFVI